MFLLPLKFRSYSRLFIGLMALASGTPSVSAAAAPIAPAPNVKTIGDVKWENGAACVEDKTASLVVGQPDATNYIAEVEVHLVAGKPPLAVWLLPDDAQDANKPAAFRADFSREKEGESLTGRIMEWDAAVNRWQPTKRKPIILEFKPSSQARPSLKNPSAPSPLDLVEREGLKPVSYLDRWIRFRAEVVVDRVDLWIDGRFVRRIDLPKPRTGAMKFGLSKGDRFRNVSFKPAGESTSFLPMDISRQAGDGTGDPMSRSSVEHDGVPFLLLNEGTARIDLDKALWPDWKRDPSSYNESYDNGPMFLFDPRTPTLQVPVEDYSAVHVLAVAQDDANTHAGFTIRAGHLNSRGQSVSYDFAAPVPRRKEVGRDKSSGVVNVGNEKLVHLHVLFSVAFSQDIFHTMDIQLTKEVRLARRRPDPSRFRYRPLGLPSGVQIAAITLERSPLQMHVTSKETGHAFVEPTKPEFTVTLRNVSSQTQQFEIQATATHLDGTETKSKARGKVESGRTEEIKLAIPVSKRGYHDIAIVLLTDGGKPLLTRHTSFAVLPPDARQHRDESPFGTWDFSGGHFTCNNADIVGSLYKKAGLRYGMFGFTSEDRKRWGVRQGNEPKLLTSAEQYRERLEKSPDTLPVALLLHEHAISGSHVTRVPDIFHDRAPYKLNEAEQKQFGNLWKTAETMAVMMRTNFSNVELRLGNGTLPMKEELLRQKFPKELFDALGNEAGSFGRPPETQPPDYIANNASLWMDHELLKAYGYTDKKVAQCYEVCYPCSNPGNLSPRTQAAYFVRHAMHSLVWGVPEFRFGCISDVGSSYRFGNWGAAGLTRPWPELNVKPSFVAVATMTRVLDGAKFTRALDLGSPSLYGVEFNRSDGKRVCVLWTIRGERALRFPVSGGKWTLTDEQGNDTPLAPKDGAIEVTLTPTPAYLIGEGEIKTAEAVAPKYTDAPRGRVSEVAALDSLSNWKIETDRNYVLEYHNFMTPRRKGDFRFEPVTEFEGEKNVLRVKPQPIAGGKPTMPMYSVLHHEKGIPLPGEPTEIGLWANGNSSWGRVIFELQDAKGQTWISIGASQRGELSPWLLDWMPKEALESTKKTTQADWNTDDVFGLSRIDFDGWRYVGFPLPGNYPGEHYPWPASSQWRYDGDGVVHYPLTFHALIMELPEKTLHLTNFAPVSRPEIYLKRLVIAQDDTSTVKQSISEWTKP